MLEENMKKFPAGLRVVVVDDDPTCLKILEQMLKSCQYEVTKCRRAEIALKLLRDKKDGFDVVISDVHMPDMDGFRLLQHIGLEMDIPVIMMSADDSKSVVMKGVTHGACDYLIKPVRMESLRNIWQHVVRKKKDKVFGDYQPKPSSKDVDCSNEETLKLSSKKRKEEKEEKRDVEESRLKKKEEKEERDDSDESRSKKARVVWSVDLKQQFVRAVNQLGGIDKAVPNKIVEVMNVPGLTRHNVASHLQKYRMKVARGALSCNQDLCTKYLRRPSGKKNGHAPMTWYNGLDFQAIASSSQQNRFVQQHNNDKQVNLDSKHLVSQPLGNSYNNSQMGQLLNEIGSGHSSLSLIPSYGINTPIYPGMTVQGGFVPSYEVFNEDWGLQGVISSFDDERNRRNRNGGPVHNQEDLMSVVNQESSKVDNEFGF